MLSTFVRNSLADIIKEIKEEENINQLKEHFINPNLKSLYNSAFPYFITFVTFNLVIFLLLILIIFKVYKL